MRPQTGEITWTIGPAVGDKRQMIDILTSGPANATVHLVLAHGAGAGMTSPFMEAMAALIAEKGLRVSRFEFAYVAERRKSGRRAPPPKAEKLISEYEAVVEEVRRSKPHPKILLIGGKSMGGRVASLIADEAHAAGKIAGLVCLGYPFHPTAKPEQLRTAHLEQLSAPGLLVQGERDPFGNRAEVESYKLSPAIRLHWAGDGDHDLGPRGGKGFTRKGNMAAAADAIAEFAAGLGR